jgi:hypothetical protein
MHVHIVGAGPTGMALAWELLTSGAQHAVTLYDRKPSAGGSWWEPSMDARDLHSHRIVFDRAYVNTRDLFEEMGIAWDDVFALSDADMYSAILPLLEAKDYFKLLALGVKVLASPEKHRRMTLEQACKPLGLSEGASSLLASLPLAMDGVAWDVMTAYEFVKSFDYVALSKQYTQKVNGKVMCDAMQRALEEKGATFRFGVTLKDVEYFKEGFIAHFDEGEPLKEGLLVLCVDHSPALDLIKNNWGPTADKKIRSSTYGCINVLLEYEKEVDFDVNYFYDVVHTEWNIIPALLDDKKTISVVIPNLTEEILTTPPDALVHEVIRQYDPMRKPQGARIAWGADWDYTKKRWRFTQSSGALSKWGQLPFFGESKKVALVGMMSEHNTPYASIETAVEVARSFAHVQFGTRRPRTPLLLTHIIFLILIVLVSVLISRAR